MSPSPIAGTFRPTVSVSDAITGVQMCRAVVTPAGFDDKPLRKAHWPTLKITATPDEDPAELKGLKAWSVPNSFAMMLVTEKDGKLRCNVAAPVATAEVGAELLTKLPIRVVPTDKPGEFQGQDNGQDIHVSMGDNAQFPTINITVSRPMEPK
jgi:hypothetical protein